MLITVEAEALGDLECRDGTSLDLLAGFPGSLADSTILPAGLVKMGNKSVARRAPI
jgi:hypothetical protein